MNRPFRLVRSRVFPVLGRCVARASLCALALAAIAVTQAQELPKLTLDNALKLALANNKVVRVESYSRDISRGNYLAALGRFDPSLNFRRTYSAQRSLVAAGSPAHSSLETDDYNLSLDGILPWGLSYSVGGRAENQRGTFNAYNNAYATFGGVSITQPLLRGFGFGANLANVRIAKADRAISDWDYRQTVIDTVTSTVIAYSELALAQDSLRIARRSLDLTASLLTENEKRYKVGSVSESDVTATRARVASREEGILFAERAVRESENRLRLLIGETSFLPERARLVIDTPTAPTMPVNPAADLKQALELRPDYQSARLGLVKYRASNSAAQNQLLPRVDFVGSYGYSGLDKDFPTARAQVRDEDNHAYSAGVVVSVPLTFAEGRGKARAARLTLRQAEANLERFEQDIALSVANAGGQIDTTTRRVAANKTAYELANQALDSELKRLRAGTSNTLFVLQQQDNLSVAESRLSQALADQRRAVATYERELGVTLERHQITLAK